MNPSKKYSFNVIEDADGWRVEVLRRVSSKRSHISKQKDGFATQEAAQAWGEAEAAALLKNMNLKAQKKRRLRNNEQADDLI